jgi:osmotically inducible protein OsmC
LTQITLLFGALPIYICPIILIFKSKKMETNNAKVLYTGVTHTTGGRTGESKSSDGQLDIILSSPGSNRPGTNPEQLFAAGWSACFIGAMGKAASNLNVKLPANHYVNTEIDLVSSDEGYSLQARLNVSLPGLDPEVAQSIVDGAHQTCPYSKATRGNIKVTINLI